MPQVLVRIPLDSLTTPITEIILMNTVSSAPVGQTGPSFAAALCGFLSTTAATTMLMLLVRSF